jgi:hypothetical protein
MLDAGIPMPAASASMPMPSYGEHIYLRLTNGGCLLNYVKNFKKIYAGITGIF